MRLDAITPVCTSYIHFVKQTSKLRNCITGNNALLLSAYDNKSWHWNCIDRVECVILSTGVQRRGSALLCCLMGKFLWCRYYIYSTVQKSQGHYIILSTDVVINIYFHKFCIMELVQLVGWVAGIRAGVFLQLCIRETFTNACDSTAGWMHLPGHGLRSTASTGTHTHTQGCADMSYDFFFTLPLYYRFDCTCCLWSRNVAGFDFFYALMNEFISTILKCSLPLFNWKPRGLRAAEEEAQGFVTKVGISVKNYDRLIDWQLVTRFRPFQRSTNHHKGRQRVQEGQS